MRPHYTLIFALIVFGCKEYSSTYPTGEVKDSYLSEEYIGRWEYISSTYLRDTTEDYYFEPHQMEVIPISDKQYLVRFVPDSLVSVDDIDLAIGHFSKIGENEYANLRMLNSHFENDFKIEFIVHKLILKGDTLNFYGISNESIKDSIPEFKSVPDHRQFILRSEDYWDLSYQYMRIKE